MRRRIHVHREIRIQPRGLLGCFLGLCALVGLAVVGVFLLLPLIGIALGVGAALVGVGLLFVGYLRLRAWLRRLLGRRDEPLVTYEAQAVDDDDDTPRPRRRLSVQVRRRPHRE